MRRCAGTDAPETKVPNSPANGRPPLTDGDYARLAAFRHALRAFLHFSEATAARAGLTGTHYQALLILRAWPPEAPVTINDLAQQLFLKHNSTVGLVDRLATGGLVVREPSRVDRRKVELRLTPRGARVVAKIADAHRDELEHLRPVLEIFFVGLSRQARVSKSALAAPRKRSAS
jgi:DNA-binding MarR family transcriptional regulator